MAEILGLGLSHYPPLASPDPSMAAILRMTLADPGIPIGVKSPENWPAAAQAILPSSAKPPVIWPKSLN